MSKSKNKGKTKEKKLVPIICVLLLIVVCILGFEIHLLVSKNQEVSFSVGQDTFEANTTITINNFHITTEGGNIVNKSYEFETNSLGTKTFILQLENKAGKIQEHEITYHIVDTTSPVIENAKDMNFYVNSSIDFDSILKTTDNYDSTVSVQIEGDYDPSTIGTYPVTAIASDSSGNTTRIPFTISIIEKPVFDYTQPYELEDTEIMTSKGYLIEIIDHIAYIDGVMIVNKSFPIPSTYAYGFMEETNTAFEQMKSDAAALGLNLYNSSGYRSYDYQKRIYNNYCNLYGQEYADTISARPGFSEHQSGYALDLNTITGAFADTEEGKWVADNCYKYGFILRYPKGKSNETGYAYEPWHIRYVGVDLATELYNNGDWITMEDYFGFDSIYPY